MSIHTSKTRASGIRGGDSKMTIMNASYFEGLYEGASDAVSKILLRTDAAYLVQEIGIMISEKREVDIDAIVDAVVADREAYTPPVSNWPEPEYEPIVWVVPSRDMLTLLLSEWLRVEGERIKNL
jgi:hypothetical protein